MNRVTKAVIPAAGLGTRFLPVTKALPKEMLPIIDIPNIHLIVEEAIKAGIHDILIIISSAKESIEDYFDDNFELDSRLRTSGKSEVADDLKKISDMANIFFVRQKEPKGLGDAILCAKSFVGSEPFAVLLGDDLIDDTIRPAIGELIEVYEKTGGTILGCKRVDESLLHKYGVVKPKDVISDDYFEISDMIEKPKTPEETPSDVAALGRYVLPPEIFDILETTKPGVGGEIQLTDAIRSSLDMRPCYACIFTGKRYDIGDKFGYLEAIIDYAMRRDDLRDRLIPYLEDVLKKNR